MLRILLYVVLGLVVTSGGILGFLWLQDASYEPYEFRGVQPEHRQGLLFTWFSPAGEDGWANYRVQLSPLLQNLHASGAVSLVLPFAHPAFKHPDKPGSWNHSVFVLLQGPGKSVASLAADRIVSRLKNTQGLEWLASIDRLRLQNGLDMFYPAANGLAREQDLEQSIEYVFSKPESRKAYYRAQYEWSGPAMADLHRRDKAGRFVGFEVIERIHGHEPMPAWDLVHIFGFTPWQSYKTKLFFFPTWNKHARRVFGEGATFQSVIKSWNKVRLKLQQVGRQEPEYTLQRSTT